MALYRLHMTEWEAAARKTTEAFRIKTSGKRKQEEESGSEDSDLDGEAAPKSKKKKAAPESFPGGGRKGISSGLSTVVKYHGKGNNSKEPRAPPPPAQSVRTRKENAVEGQWWA
jgi:RNA exonuclease 4